MTKEELLKKIDFEKSWLYDCGIFGSDVDIAFHAIKNSVIETLEQEECEDCISRKEALKLFEDRFIELQKVHQKDTQYGVNWCINTLKELPSVNPQKTGHWTERKIHKPTGFFLPTCSECGSIQPCTNHTFKWNYCPNCGAKMIEPQERSNKE